MAHLGVRSAARTDGRVSVFDVAVVGAGWSGLACAVLCVQRGERVVLLDAAPQVGGRARRVSITLGDRDYSLDNGQHLLIGAYSETEQLMCSVGADPNRLLRRIPLTLAYPDGFCFKAGRWPAPLHLVSGLVGARGLNWHDRSTLLRLTLRWRRTHWIAPTGASAAQLLRETTPTLMDRFFEPLCLAALNLRLAQASGQIFLNVLRASIGSERSASDFWVPLTDLSALAPDAALAWLRDRGSEVRLRTPVSQLAHDAGRWTVTLREGGVKAHAVVLAVPPERAHPLLATVEDATLAPAIEMLSRVEHAPIATVYLRYEPGTRMPEAVMALREDPQRRHYGQWAFDRGMLDPRNDGVIAVIVSGRGPHMELAHETLCIAVADQLCAALALPPPLATAAVVERRATIWAVPELKRPSTRLPRAGLYLAGDAADSPYPSTIEGSVRSGFAAASAWLSDRST